MALGEFMTRKWVKPFIAFFALTVVSLLAFGSITSRIGAGVMYASGNAYRARPRSRTQSEMELTAPSRNTVYQSHPGRGLSTIPPDQTKNDKTTPNSQAPITEMILDGNVVTSYTVESPYEDENSEIEWINQLERTNSGENTKQEFPANISDFRTMSERTNHASQNIYVNSNNSGGTKEKPVFIVLMGRMRTGSSLIGEIFNQNPSVGFLFEPLHAVCEWNKKGTIHKSRFAPAAATLLRKISSCEFPPNFISSIIKWPAGGGARSSMIQPVCAMTSSCKRANSSMLRHQCLTYKKYRGIKTIRADLNLLFQLVKEDTVDVKILHLIRDPRGVANSRRQVYSVDSNSVQRRLAARGYRKRILHEKPVPNPFDNHDPQARRPMWMHNHHFQHPITRGTRLDILGLMGTSDLFPLLNTIPAYCKWLDSTITLAQKRPDWLQGRYKLIRYEDYAASPMSVTEDVYRYFSMDLPDRVRRWVANNTEDDVKGIKDIETLYGSHKNSTKAAFKWRTAMTSQEAVQVERQCGDIMKRLGYRRTSARVQLGDLKQSLFLPLPNDIPREL